MDSIIQNYIYLQHEKWTQNKKTKIDMEQNKLKGIAINGHI